MGQVQIMTHESRNTAFIQASDITLVGAAKQGNSAAFNILAKRYEAKIFRVTLRITRNQEDAQDATDDAKISMRICPLLCRCLHFGFLLNPCSIVGVNPFEELRPGRPYFFGVILIMRKTSCDQNKAPVRTFQAISLCASAK
jgi:hypothetical protein